MSPSSKNHPTPPRGTRPETVREAVEDPETRSRLLNVTRRIAASATDAEDALQDAMVQALSHADRFRSDSRVSTWLHRIAINAALMARRRGATWSRRRIALDGVAGGMAPDLEPQGRAGPSTWSAATDPSPSAEQQLVAMEERQRLRWAISRLPARSRRTIEAYLSEAPMPDELRSDRTDRKDSATDESRAAGVSFTTAIDIPTEVTTNALRARLSRARSRLKGLLDGLDVGLPRAA